MSDELKPCVSVLCLQLILLNKQPAVNAPVEDTPVTTDNSNANTTDNSNSAAAPVTPANTADNSNAAAAPNSNATPVEDTPANTADNSENDNSDSGKDNDDDSNDEDYVDEEAGISYLITSSVSHVKSGYFIFDNIGCFIC